MKRPRVLQFTLLVAATPSAVAFAGEVEKEKPVVVDINKSCLTVADVALPWLRRHRIQVDGPGQCTDQTCSFALHFLKMRNVPGLPIFNFNGRYVQGGKWHSFLTAPHVAGGGPDVKSNHRLESDYAQGITAEVARLCGGHAQSSCSK